MKKIILAIILAPTLLLADIHETDKKITQELLNTYILLQKITPGEPGFWFISGIYQGIFLSREILEREEGIVRD